LAQGYDKGRRKASEKESIVTERERKVTGEFGAMSYDFWMG